MSRAMISLLVLAVLVLPPATIATVTMATRNCPSICGFDLISYPFGVGPSCSLPGFSFTCVATSYLVLGNSTQQVSFPSTAIASRSYVLTTISYSVKMITGVRDYSIHWEAPARPFAISGSSNMSLFVVGCGIMASLFIDNSGVEVGKCSVVCAEAQIMEKLPTGTCDAMVGLGCCFIDIQVNLRAFTLDISRINGSPSSKQVQAYISDNMDPSFTPIGAYSGFQYSGRAQLDWSIPYQPNCKRAMEDKDSYACVSNHSKCRDSPIGGYLCYCQSGAGNAYSDGGCTQGVVYLVPSRPRPNHRRSPAPSRRRHHLVAWF